jgi:hypothetical protein
MQIKYVYRIVKIYSKNKEYCHLIKCKQGAIHKSIKEEISRLSDSNNISIFCKYKILTRKNCSIGTIAGMLSQRADCIRVLKEEIAALNLFLIKPNNIINDPIINCSNRTLIKNKHRRY